MKFSIRQRLHSLLRLRLAARNGVGRLNWGKNVYLGPRSTIAAIGDLTLGDNIYIGKSVTIEVSGSIGDGCLISNNVGIVGRKDHDPAYQGDMFWAPSARDTESLRLDLRIENGVWIGFGATILSGLTIGARSIIAAGAIVTRNVPANSIVTGLNGITSRAADK